MERVGAALPDIEDEAIRLDREGGFPQAAFALLREAGAMTAPLPVHLGGGGLGTEPGGARPLLAVLRRIGQGSLAVGRLYEGHVNAIKLIALYGTPAQLRSAAEDARAGHLFGIWVTAGAVPLLLRRSTDAWRLEGEKRFASGALHVTRPLVTATCPDGHERMVVVPLGANRSARDTLGGLHGMRAACTGSCDFSGMAVGEDALVGGAGDYLRQPEFSGGAWRGVAVALGGIDRLVDLLRQQLRARERDASPHQRVRIGEALIAREAAAMWATRAADAAECGTLAAGDVMGVVGLARIAAEHAALDVIRLVQRGLGLGGFLSDNPAERIMRDLATYLRQPAPDETLTEAAEWFTTRDLPPP